MLGKPLTIVAGPNSNQNLSAFFKRMNSVDCIVLSTNVSAASGKILGEETH